jgi:hypothetical protein
MPLIDRFGSTCNAWMHHQGRAADCGQTRHLSSDPADWGDGAIFDDFHLRFNW